MKRVLLFCLLLICVLHVFAQDSTSKKDRLTATITESFYVLKSDKQTRTGLYQASFKRNIPLASGVYLNNKRAGIWHFYDLSGSIIENFDFDRNALLYEKPDDTLSEQQIQYAFDQKITDSDIVTKPIKPGGRYYGYLPYMQLFKLSDDFMGTDPGLFSAFLEILVSPAGRLADVKVHIKSDDFERVTTFSTELINDADKTFIPATINGKHVLSRIFVKCRLTGDGDLDVAY